MPLRDHFRPPVWNQVSWEGFHAQWPAVIVQQLAPQLPEQFSIEPRVHLGTNFEIDVCAFESAESFPPPEVNGGEGGTATALATCTAPAPTRVAEVELTEEYAYEVLIFDLSRARELVAAIELVSPGNKDRPESRQAFVTKCAALLQNRVCVSIIDLVTTRHFNLYCELMTLVGRPDPEFRGLAPATYAVTCRGRKIRGKPNLEMWTYPLIVGQPLPVLPIWLSEEEFLSLDLEASYEATCRTFRIR